VSKKRGLPTAARMRHDAHFVDSLSERFGAAVGRLIPIEEIEPNPGQPRSSLGDLSELTKSIESKGVLEPLLVRQLEDGRLQIIAGERRYRAAIAAGLSELPCIELDVPENEVIEIALIENLHRKDLHPFEEAEGYASLQTRFAYTQQQVADAVGRKRVSVTEALSLLQIPEELRAECRRADIEARSVLLQVARQGDDSKMRAAIDRIIAGSTRDDLRREKRETKEGKRGKRFTFVFKPKGGPFKLNLSFAKARVEKQELIQSLREVVRQLESGAIKLAKR
jgi:ParB family chromosome partitioning protein